MPIKIAQGADLDVQNPRQYLAKQQQALFKFCTVISCQSIGPDRQGGTPPTQCTVQNFIKSSIILF